MTPTTLVHSRLTLLGWANSNPIGEKGANAMNKIKGFLRDESGIETLEYAVIGAIVAAVAVLIYGTGWGQSVRTTLVRAASQSTGTVTT